jgi:hypothetical protein
MLMIQATVPIGQLKLSIIMLGYYLDGRPSKEFQFLLHHYDVTLKLEKLVGYLGQCL